MEVSKSILVFVKFLYGISQNIFLLLQGMIRPQNLLTFLFNETHMLISNILNKGTAMSVEGAL